MKLLIIEDERDLSNSIVTYLSSENYLCEQAFTYNEAKDKINLYDYDCILLDLMLPGGNGLDVLREIRHRNNPVGVIIISAKDSLDDKISGSELSMRIYAIIRRKEFSSNNLLQSNNITINLLSKSVSVNDQLIILTRTEYELLLFFISNKNKVISKSAIAEHLSGDMADMLDSHDFVYTHIKNLKAKLAEKGCKESIKNVYGTGYKWLE